MGLIEAMRIYKKIYTPRWYTCADLNIYPKEIWGFVCLILCVFGKVVVGYHIFFVAVILHAFYEA